MREVYSNIYSMRIGVVIERARESKRMHFISKVTLIAKDKRLCYQGRAIINKSCRLLCVSENA